MSGSAGRPELAGLHVADAPELWTALGFTVNDGRAVLDGVVVALGAPGTGLTGWTLRNAADRIDCDGLPTAVTAQPPPSPTVHPNEAIGIDHVVVTTPDFDRTAAALAAAGMPLRRVRDAGGSRQGFRRLGPAILELVEAPAPASPTGPARFWGLVVIVPDLGALRRRLAPHVSEIRDAVQPGRHIAGLRRDAGLSVRVAFMDPE